MFQILVHRGLSEYPENSSLALQKTLESGFGIEIDVHRTKDGILVVTHDSNLLRLYGKSQLVTKLILNEIKQIGRAKNHEIPTLKEMLELFRKHAKPKTLVAVQIKNSREQKIADLTVKAFEEFNKDYPKFDIYGRAFVFDPVKEIATKIKKLQPKVKVALSIGEDEIFTRELYRKKYPTIYVMKDIENFKYFDIVWADEWQNGLYSREFAEKVHKMGKKVYAVSPELHKNTELIHPHALNLEKIKKGWINLISWEFDGICTDYPVELSKVLTIEK